MSLEQRIEALIEQWDKDLETYPIESDERALFAYTTLKLAQEELRMTLNES